MRTTVIAVLAILLALGLARKREQQKPSGGLEDEIAARLRDFRENDGR